MTYRKFAFAIYWTSWNVRSFIDTPIISQQASILLDVTYWCMGISHSLKMDKERPFFNIDIRMKKIHLFLIFFVLLSACRDTNAPVIPGGSKDKSVGFSYELTKPFTISFLNTSSNISRYKWDFGDGYTSTQESPMHTYNETGKYRVTLTGDDTYECHATITISKPKIYVAGWRLYNIPYENKYYKLAMYDDDWFGNDWWFETVYTKLLCNSDLPFTHKFNKPVLMDKLDGDNYYTIKLYYSKNTSSDGTLCYSTKLTKEYIYKYWDEYVWTSSEKGVKLGVLMEYK